MNSAYLQAQAEDYSERCSLDSDPSDMSNGTITASESLPPESVTESSPMPLSSAISEHSSVTGTPQAIREWLMSLQGDSRVNHSACKIVELNTTAEKTQRGGQTIETCGPSLKTSFAWYDPNGACWRTFQGSFLQDTFHAYSETWPKAGIVCGGVAYHLRKSAPNISENGYGLLPTPHASDMYVKLKTRASIQRYYTADHDHTSKLPYLLQMNGWSWQEIMNHYEATMGWIPSWTALEPLEMDKIRMWLQQHGGF